jgi:chromosome segregation ATPase
MGNRSYHGGSRGSSGQRFGKSQHNKAKVREHKHREKGAYVREEKPVTTEMLIEKTLNSLKRLGEQKFAVSPFRQYFDDWLINIEQTLSEFESNPAINVDQEFIKESAQILTEIERELAELKREETALEPCIRELADTNHFLLKLDTDYTTNTRETAARRNTEIQRLTQSVHNLEEELERVKATKTSIIGGLSKKAKAQKIAEANTKLESAKTELEKMAASFRKDQERLHDSYEKNKQATMKRVRELENKIEKLENDNSIAARQATSGALTRAVKALLERQPKLPSESV